MKTEIAYLIAEKFIKSHNPNLWNGNGKMDVKFSTKIQVYDIFDTDVYMTIQFEIDADEGGKWAHEVKLYDNSSDELIDGYFGYGVDSVQNLADTIMDLCRDYVEK